MIMAEFLDVYTINGEKTGEVVERYKHKKSGAFYLCPHAYILTPDKSFIIQKRSSLKKYFPGIWDITCGAAESGETSFEAILREVREELGLDLSSATCEYIGRSIFDDCLNDVYLFYTDFFAKDCDFDINEVEEVKEVDKKELLNLIKNSQFKDNNYYEMIKNFLEKV